jgi:hypothetical protein
MLRRGQVHYGEPETQDDIGELYHNGKTIKARIIEGRNPLDGSAKLTGKTMTVKKLLAPLDSSLIPTIRALGAQFSTGEGFKQTAVPVLFYKPLHTLAGPEDPIVRAVPCSPLDWHDIWCAEYPSRCAGQMPRP